jgi:competence protein ComEC
LFSIGFVVLLWKELRVEATGRLNNLIKSGALLVVLSLAATFATSPLVARYFNQMSLAGLVSNIIVVPFAGLAVVPLGLFSGILSLFTHVLPLAGLNQFVADLFIRTVGIFSLLPAAEFHPRSPRVLWLLVYAALVASVAQVLRARLLSRFRPLEYSSRFPRFPVVIAILSFLILAAASGLYYLPKSAAEAWAPDVGQGDANLIRLPGNKNILIDGGGSFDDRFDIGRNVLAPFLWNRGVGKLDLVILSHPHPDHMNGLKFILKKFDVEEVWSHGLDSHLPGYDDFLRVIRDRNIRHKTVSADTPPVNIGEAKVSILHPGKTFQSHEKKDYAEENDRSLVARIAFRDQVLLFTGDIGTGAENFLVRTGKKLKCDLLKVPHHGSKSSSSAQFLAAARPLFVFIPVGKKNRYRHPSPEVIDRYRGIRANILRTDQDGAVSIRFGEKGIAISRTNDLELRRFDDIRHLLFHRERENWKRLWLRKWEL